MIVDWLERGAWNDKCDASHANDLHNIHKRGGKFIPNQEIYSNRSYNVTVFHSILFPHNGYKIITSGYPPALTDRPRPRQCTRVQIRCRIEYQREHCLWVDLLTGRKAHGKRSGERCVYYVVPIPHSITHPATITWIPFIVLLVHVGRLKIRGRGKSNDLRNNPNLMGKGYLMYTSSVSTTALYYASHSI